MIEVPTFRPAFLFPDGIGTLPDGLLVGDLSVSRGNRRDNPARFAASPPLLSPGFGPVRRS
jgi:hypothetical protein